MAACKSRFVAAITRTSERIERVPPTRSNSFSGNKLLGCSRFASYEDRRITRCNFGDARENTFQSGRCSDDLFKHRSFVDFFTQSDVFAPKPVFRPLAVVDVRQGDIPTS